MLGLRWLLLLTATVGKVFISCEKNVQKIN